VVSKRGLNWRNVAAVEHASGYAYIARPLSVFVMLSCSEERARGSAGRPARD